MCVMQSVHDIFGSMACDICFGNTWIRLGETLGSQNDSIHIQIACYEAFRSGSRVKSSQKSAFHLWAILTQIHTFLKPSDLFWGFIDATVDGFELKLHGFSTCTAKVLKHQRTSRKLVTYGIQFLNGSAEFLVCHT